MQQTSSRIYCDPPHFLTGKTNRIILNSPVKAATAVPIDRGSAAAF